MKTNIFEIPGKVALEWEPVSKSIIYTRSAPLSIDEFKQVVLVRGANYAKAAGARAWIVDSTGSKLIPD